MPNTPSAEEQLLLELINRFRTNPGAEADLLTGPNAPDGVASAVAYFGVSIADFHTQLAALGPAAPLAWNGNLADAADGHNQAMIAADAQSHQAPGEPDLGQRATNAGYSWSALGENVYAFANDAAYGHAGFVIDWGYDSQDYDGDMLYADWQSRGDGMQDPPGHRTNLMNTVFTEIGIGIVAESDSATQVGPELITEDLGSRFDYQAQFFGVVINDLDHDNFYDIGEGLGGVTVTLQQGDSSYVTTSWSSGGWQIAVPAGSYTITFSGGGLAAPLVASATLGTINVKVDAIAENAPANTPTEGPDTLTGTAGGDTIGGLGGDDHISGLGGNDQIDGGAGADSMSGGAGDDLFVVDSAGDTVIEQAGEGNDMVRTGLASYTLAANVERLTGTSASGQALTGNALANVITGGSGNDVIAGGSGSDQLRGGLGNDVYTMDTSDTIVEAANAGTDEVRTVIAAYTLGANLENLTGTSSAGQALTGNGLANVITGGAGNDVIAGGSGADQLKGGLGNDTYTMDTSDTIVEAANAGIDEVRTVIAAYTLGANLENLTGTSSSGQSLTGNGVSNRITGGGGNDVLGGGAGNDSLAGGNGADILVGGTGADSLKGGAGADMFRYASAADSTSGAPDLIGDFQVGVDKIDLHLIDANTLAGGDQAFHWIGSNAFSGTGAASAGELRVYQSGSHWWAAGDINGDGTADLVIALTPQGAVLPAQGDFIL